MSEKTLYCSFCGKSQHEVRKLFAGPGETFICDECVGICNEIIAEELPGPSKVPMHERSTADQLAHLHKAVVDLSESLLEVMKRATDKGEVEHIIAQRVRSLALRPIINPVEG